MWSAAAKAFTRIPAKSSTLFEFGTPISLRLDLLKSEQDRIARDLALTNERIAAAAVEFDTIEGTLRTALDYAVNCDRGYLAAPHKERRLFNQAFFSKIFVHDDYISTELAEPFKTLFGAVRAPAPAPARAVATSDANQWLPLIDGAANAGPSPLTDVLRRQNNKPAPSGAG